MEKHWQRLRKRLLFLALSISLALLFLGGMAVFWLSQEHQPLVSWDLLDLSDNSTGMMLPLLLNNEGRLPLAIDEVLLSAPGLWCLEVRGWLSEPRLQVGPALLAEIDDLTGLATPLGAGSSGQLLLVLQPDAEQGEQQLIIRYHTLPWFEYALYIPLQDEKLDQALQTEP